MWLNTKRLFFLKRRKKPRGSRINKRAQEGGVTFNSCNPPFCKTSFTYFAWATMHSAHLHSALASTWLSSVAVSSLSHIYLSYIRKSEWSSCKVIYEDMLPNLRGNAQIFNHIWGGHSSYMTLQLRHSEFPYIWGKFYFLFFCAVF